MEELILQRTQLAPMSPRAAEDHQIVLVLPAAPAGPPGALPQRQDGAGGEIGRESRRHFVMSCLTRNNNE